jgi:hypothetical protein
MMIKTRVKVSYQLWGMHAGVEKLDLGSFEKGIAVQH